MPKCDRSLIQPIAFPDDFLRQAKNIHSRLGLDYVFKQLRLAGWKHSSMFDLPHFLDPYEDFTRPFFWEHAYALLLYRRWLSVRPAQLKMF